MSGINFPRMYLAGVAAGGFSVLVQLAAWALGAYDRLGRAIGQSYPVEAVATYGAAVFALEVFVGGPLAVWLYAAIRPRFGAGPRTAVIAAIYIWLVLGPYGFTVLSLSKLLAPMSMKLMIVLQVSMLPLVVVALLIGGYLYREDEATKAAGA